MPRPLGPQTRGATQAQRQECDSARNVTGAKSISVSTSQDRLALIEAKSSKIESSSLLAGVKCIRRHFAHDSCQSKVTVAYGGNESQKRPEVELVPRRALGAAI